jgi:uncharacterized membrane protein (UPF0136 family)
MPADVLGVVYAGIVAAGGVIGYLKAGSVPSLLAGLVSGLCAGYGAFTSNYYILLSVSLLLSGLMGYRFMNSGKVMPAGMVAALSILIVIRCVIYFTTQKN